jgi:hypothetical protein
MLREADSRAMKTAYVAGCDTSGKRVAKALV